MTDTNLQINTEKHEHATLWTVASAVKKICEITTERLNGNAYHDEQGYLINDEQLLDVVNELAFNALAEIDDLKRQIEVLAIHHEHKADIHYLPVVDLGSARD